MRVTFYKLTEKRISVWEATRGKRTRIPGSAMALGRGGMPHDLLQMLVEGTVGVDRGFWGSVAAGATFRSTGRKRTKPGKAVISGNRAAIDHAEHIVGCHLHQWAAGAETPCAEVLDAFDQRWRDLRDGEGLAIAWPSLKFLGTVSATHRRGHRMRAGSGSLERRLAAFEEADLCGFEMTVARLSGQSACLR